MSIVSYLVVERHDIKPHALSLIGYYQDDGFGDCVNTFTLCKKNQEIGEFVISFINDEFIFVD